MISREVIMAAQFTTNAPSEVKLPNAIGLESAAVIPSYLQLARLFVEEDEIQL
jgi:hypothetical protein